VAWYQNFNILWFQDFKILISNTEVQDSDSDLIGAKLRMLVGIQCGLQGFFISEGPGESLCFTSFSLNEFLASVVWHLYQLFYICVKFLMILIFALF
jgi:hypothetical protein